VYIWQSPSEPLAVHIAQEVVSGLSLAGMEGLKSVPGRGLEVGGLLLGRRELRDGVTVIHIDGSAPVKSEYRSGPNYRLSDTDWDGLKEALAVHSNAVGFYRTQTRTGALAPREEDAALFKHYLNPRYGLFLLVQPSAARAAYYLAKGGTMAQVHEFGYQPADLPAAADEEVPPAAAAPTPPQPSAPGKAIQWQVAAVAVLLGMVAGAAIVHLSQRTSKPEAAAILPTKGTDNLQLKAERAGDTVRLVWDRNSAIIRNATHALLAITDGAHDTQLDLAAPELHSGSFTYRPETAEVTFWLKVFDPDHQVEEAVRSTAPAAQAEAQLAPPPQLPPQAASRPEPEAKPSPAPAQPKPLPSSPPSSKPAVRADAKPKAPLELASAPSAPRCS
jgi:hypothetical protein